MLEDRPLILIVDDESDSLACLYDLLHNDGFRVLPSANSMEALEHVAKKRPHLIICDLRMPDLDGLELLDRVRQLSPATRVLLLASPGDRSLLSEVLRRGGEGMLLKPTTSREVLGSVRQALEGAGRCST